MQHTPIPTPPPPLAFNPDDYRETLAAHHLTPQQADDLLHLLWNITATFAQMGFGMEATQLAIGHMAHSAQPPATPNKEQPDDVS